MRPKHSNTSGPKELRNNQMKYLLSLLLLMTTTTIASPLTYEVTLTAYCPCRKCCGVNSDGRTASGVKPMPGHTCACNGLPFGTRIDIPSLHPSLHHTYVVEDRMAKRYRTNHVDIFFSSHKEALNFGVKRVMVIVQPPFEKK